MQGLIAALFRFRNCRWSHLVQLSTRSGQLPCRVEEPGSRAVKAPGSIDEHSALLRGYL